MIDPRCVKNLERKGTFNILKMKAILSMLIFCLVLFIYLHVYFHLKTSDDLEVYEIEQPSKDKLEEICDLRQPVMFDFAVESLMETFKRSIIGSTYGAFDIKIRDVSRAPSDDEELYIPMSYTSCISALDADSDSKYVVENNMDFLEETALIKSFRYNDAFIRPYMVSSCMYDFITASNGTCTPFRYNVDYRNFFLATEGEITIKLAPPKSARYLYQETDYENFEFRSPVNPWVVQQQYKPDFDKVKCLEVTLNEGQMIYIPAYWWYSISFTQKACICNFRYRTYMNTVAVLPKLAMRVLQSQNVKRRIAKSLEIEEKSTESQPVNTIAQTDDNKKEN